MLRSPTCSAGIVKSWRASATWGVDSPVDRSTSSIGAAARSSAATSKSRTCPSSPAKRHPRFHPGAQDDGVHERPDNRNQLRVPATRHDCGDPHVRLPERRATVAASAACRTMNSVAPREAARCARCAVTSASISKSIEPTGPGSVPGWSPREAEPDRSPREHASRIRCPGHGTPCRVPQRVVDILHRQRRPTRRVADEPCLVRRHEVGHQDRDRRTVRGKVIEFDLERVGPGAIGSEGHTQRDRVVVRFGTSRGPDRRVRAGGVVGVEGAQNS